MSVHTLSPLAVVCLSGGLDSTSLLLRLLRENRQVFGLSFDYGQKHRLELERLAANLAYLKENGQTVNHRHVDLSSLGPLLHSALTDEQRDIPTGHYEQANMKETVVPNRNAIFASIAYGYAHSLALSNDSHVALSLGVHSGDHAIYPDCRPEFYDALWAAFQVGNWDSERVTLYLPYLDWDKHLILQDATESITALQLDFETIFRNTCTSYQPDAAGRSHGLTGSDVERILAFDQLGRPDPLAYVQPWEVVLATARRMDEEHQHAPPMSPPES